MINKLKYLTDNIKRKYDEINSQLQEIVSLRDEYDNLAEYVSESNKLRIKKYLLEDILESDNIVTKFESTYNRIVSEIDELEDLRSEYDDKTQYTKEISSLRSKKYLLDEIKEM